MRKSKTEKTEVDLLKPAIVPDGDPEDCFGTELYDPKQSDCSICADIELCGIKRQEALQKKVKALSKEKGPFLDETDFKSVPWNKIEKKAIDYAADGEPMTFEELVEAVHTFARSKDETAVIEYIKRVITEKGLYLDNGQVLALPF